MDTRGEASARWLFLGANFYEKALFVKTDVAVAPCGRVQLLSALRALCFYSHFQ